MLPHDLSIPPRLNCNLPLLICICRTGGPATRRTISLEARAAPVNAAQAAPKCPGSTGRNVAARSSSNGAHGSASQAAAPSSTGDVLQSAEDDLDMEDTVRVKSHAQVGVTPCMTLAELGDAAAEPGMLRSASQHTVMHIAWHRLPLLV